MLLKEISNKVDGIEQDPEPAVPEGGWSVGHLSHHGLILSCDGFTAKLGPEDLQKFFDIAEDGEAGEIHDQNGDLILVEPTEDSIVLTRTGDKIYPSGITLDLKTLKELGIEQGKAEPEETPDVPVEEGVKRAYRRSGKKIKKGFRVTSGYRKGRVVASLKTAYKPRAKASTRMKLSIAGRRKKFIRLLKSRRTRKKSISKRLRRMNK
jgi:hypothetical protein